MSRRSALVVSGFLPILLGLVAGIVLLILPLPTLNVLGTPAGWCGPGSTSDNAVQVLLNPEVVTEGSTSSEKSKIEFQNFCLGEARTRFVQAGTSVGAGCLLGLGLAVIVMFAGPRQATGGR